MELLIVPGLPILLLLASTAGSTVRSRMGEQHRARETVDALRVVMSIMVTFAALVLGLLTSAAKSEFDGQVRGLQTFGISLIELDQRLREYGTDADPARATLRRYTAAAIADTWPTEPAPSGDFPRVGPDTGTSQIESPILGNLLLGVDEQISALLPGTRLQRHLVPVLERHMSSVLQRRWQIVTVSNFAVAWPFMAVMLLWLTSAFFTFGLSTPANRLTALVLALAAVSVSAAVYLIVDFATPLSGLLHLPSAPLRDALQHMDAVALGRGAPG